MSSVDAATLESDVQVDADKLQQDSRLNGSKGDEPQAVSSQIKKEDEQIGSQNDSLLPPIALDETTLSTEIDQIIATSEPINDNSVNPEAESFRKVSSSSGHLDGSSHADRG